jgi:hypothetical protein
MSWALINTIQKAPVLSVDRPHRCKLSAKHRVEICDTKNYLTSEQL